MASTRNKTLSRQQYERRADGRIVRVEVSLNAKNTGDIFIADHLSALPPEVTKSDYLRDALLDKIMTERRETDTDRQIAALRDEIAALKTLVVELTQREIKVQMVQATQVTVGPVQQPADPALTQSSGLNMNQVRPRKPLARGPVVDQAIDVTEEFDPVALARQMAQSIRTANPGRREA